MEGTMSLSAIENGDLRQRLFTRVVEILETERATNRSLVVTVQSPVLYSLRRFDGCVLIVYIAPGDHALIRGELKWCYPEHQGEPWSFDVTSADGVNFRMDVGPQRSIDEIARYIGTTFLGRSKNSVRLSGADRERIPTTVPAVIKLDGLV
jgi:hypothetical protein